MSVPYEEALNSLQSMFSSFDRELIGAVLQQNKGHMEKTIDALLEMSGETPINQNTDSDASLAQLQQDEMMARMLQNDLFVNELRNDEDFARLFQQRESQAYMQQQRRLRQQQQQQQQPQQQQQSPTSRPVSHDHEDGVSPLTLFEEDFGDIKEKLNNLGEAAKTKFRELADFFMKKEESQYNAVRTTDDDEEASILPKSNSGSINGGGGGRRHDEDEVVVFDRSNRNNFTVNSNNNSNNNHSNYSINDDDSGSYDSFVLEDRSKENRSMGSVKLRSLKDSKKDDD
ncbi:hypothetical protein DFA_05703 [Cavenderia fasciculata]|uniref:CUE domain-containing protein n=1 Tax=Cavenderia fasciculata TaxID=261658 RepID=F4PM70_CACFS|nr:uncharacterized protein DFA_05703 [Cavenderia fasciculata]EGG23570.1 hypothetical protein DFA_05703 [Cavenderia fasciculata]|eukprot:XP_004361421.1 hypothetical protein DFA_05703 [Cavenderia fasciculata]